MFLAVYVLFMTRDLGLDSLGVGLVFATGGVGSLAGSLVAERGPPPRPGATMICAQVAFGLIGTRCRSPCSSRGWPCPR